MVRSRITVRQLAAEADIDVDEALIILWDNDIDVAGPASTIPKRKANQARRAVGIATRRELSSLDTWERSFASSGVGGAEFALILRQLAIAPATQGRLTKKSINKLRAEFRSKGFELSKEQDDHKQIATPLKPFTEQLIGRPKGLYYLNYPTVLAIHNQLAEDFAQHDDPIDPPGARENGHLLQSAMLRPQTSLGEVRKYPSAEMAGAALMHSLIHNHPFHNGNKRTALVSTLVFLDQNGLLLTCSDEELFKFVVTVAQHSLIPSRPIDRLHDREVQGIAQWIRNNSRVMESGERPIPFRRMRRILTRYGCMISQVKGYHVDISRTIEAKAGILGIRTRQTVLSTNIAYNDEGREVSKDTIAKIRRDLELDDLHGYDSASFYDNAPECADEFIAKYRKILRRLAQL